jgi:hypothetical protein
MVPDRYFPMQTGKSAFTSHASFHRACKWNGYKYVRRSRESQVTNTGRQDEHRCCTAYCTIHERKLLLRRLPWYSELYPWYMSSCTSVWTLWLSHLAEHSAYWKFSSFANCFPSSVVIESTSPWPLGDPRLLLF